MIKRKILLALCTTLSIGFTAACGTDGNSESFGPEARPEEKIWVIATDTSFEPFEYTDENNRFTGIDVDIIAAVAEDQGFRYELQSLGWDTAVAAVQSGQADAILAGATASQSRIAGGWIFSDEYFESSQTFAVAKDSGISCYEDLKGKNVAVKDGTAGAEFAEGLKDRYDFTVTVYVDSPTMYQDVLLGNSAACVEDKTTIQTVIKKENLELTVPEGMESEPAPYGMAIMDEDSMELLEMFNKGLANIKASGKYDEILATYLGT